MNRINLSQRLNARMHFKSLLLLSLLAGSASAQSPMPTIPFELPDTPTVPTVIQPDTQVDAMRSTWTLRQHTSWVLGLKSRRGVDRANINTIQPTMVDVPHIDIVSTADALTEMPANSAISTPTSATQPGPMPLSVLPMNTWPVDAPRDSSSLEPAMPEVPPAAIQLVQHNQPLPQLAGPASSDQQGEVTTAGHTQNSQGQVSPVHQPAPHSLNLGPVVSGPVPEIPMEQLAGDSLMKVDVSGVDVSQLNSTEQTGASLIDGLGFRPPTGFSMRDDDASSVAASPSRAKPVSVHEGFAPRTSSANQATQLRSDDQTIGRSSERLSVGSPGANQFSLSDKAESSTGPVVNRLSDKEAVHERMSDTDRTTSVANSSKAVEKSFSDKGPLLSAMPVQVSSDSEKTSRSGKPVELTPPTRLAHEAARALPLAASPIASTGIEASLPGQNDVVATHSQSLPASKSQSLPTPVAPTSTSAAQTAERLAAVPVSDKSVSDKPVSDKPVSDKPVSDKPTATSTLSLIEGFVPPTLLTTTEPKALPLQASLDSHAKQESASKDTKQPSVPQLIQPENEKSKPVSTESVAVKAEPTKSAERITLSDFNPIAMKRPVIKAASVALPAAVEAETATEGAVIPSSHEVDEATQQLSEYAKLASKLQQSVKQKFPAVRVKITSNEDGLVVDGHVENNVEATKVLSYIRKTSLCPVADRLTTSQ